MSFRHSGTSQSFLEDYAILAQSPVDVQDPQRTESLSDSPYAIPMRGGGSADTTTGVYPVSECTTPLQPPPLIPGLQETADDDIYDTASVEQAPTSTMFREELCILVMYSLPVFGYVLPPISFIVLILDFFSSTQLFEYSFIIASVVAIGHISTIAMAAATLGSMTASVTGYSIVQGFASTLDTLLPPTWTSDRPYMVGLWSQRMGSFFLLHCP